MSEDGFIRGNTHGIGVEFGLHCSQTNTGGRSGDGSQVRYDEERGDIRVGGIGHDCGWANDCIGLKNNLQLLIKSQR